MAIKWRDPFYEPLRELSRLQEEMNRLFENLFGRGPLLGRESVFPALNLYEDHDNLYATAQLPGVGPEHLDITVEEESLIIRGVRRLEPVGEDGSYHLKEREGGPFNRKIVLPARVVPARVHAEAQNGLLTVVLPKAEEVKPKRIKIKVE